MMIGPIVGPGVLPGAAREGGGTSGDKRYGNRGEDAVRTPVQERAKEKKARIVLAAVDLFTERGYQAVGMRDIAAAADVSIGTMYAYFVDKREIFIEVFGSYSEEIKESVFTYLETEPSDHRDIERFVSGLIRRFYEAFRSRIRIYRDGIVLSLVDDQVRSVYAALERRGEEAVMAAFVERFGDMIEVGDPEAARLVLHKAIDEIAQYFLFYDVPIDPERAFREAARMIARYLEKR
jgi:AcrR family transcriptional regulator